MIKSRTEPFNFKTKKMVKRLKKRETYIDKQINKLIKRRELKIEAFKKLLNSVNTKQSK